MNRGSTKRAAWMMTWAAACCVGMASASDAAVIGTYTFDNTDGTNNAPASKSIDSQPASATFSDFTVTGVTEVIGGKGANNGNRLATSGWEGSSQAWNDGKHLAFTVEADDGFTIALSTLDLLYNRANGGPFGTSPRDGRLLVSDDDFATSTAFILFTDSEAPSNTDVAVGVDLSSLGQADRWSFRLQFSGASNTVIRIDDVAVDASVVPEPASLALLGAGLLSVVPRRRSVPSREDRA